MINKKDTYGNYIYQFGLAVDIVDDKTFESVWEIIQDYLGKHLKIEFLSLKVETLVDYKRGLRTVKGQGEERPAFSLMSEPDENGERHPTGQTAYSFVNKKNLWIVDKGKGVLHEKKSEHIDLWENGQGFPHKPEHKRQDSKTSILIPIERRGRTAGVVEFESTNYIESTDLAKKELMLISETISRIKMLHDLQRSQSRSTKKAVNRLRSMMSDVDWPLITKPSLFVAYSDRAKEDVTGTIKNVLNGFSKHLNTVYWNSINKAGNINLQLLEEISRSTYGLCYFSEPNTSKMEKKYEYQDNPNVIFEAGMFQSLTNSPSLQPFGWIPVREMNSPPTPFDFAADRFVIIERLNHGELNMDEFSDNLRKRVKTLIGV